MISVAMTTFNGERFVEKQLMSILSQTRLPDELVIYDDCSTDGTVEIVKTVIKSNNTPTMITFQVNDCNQGFIRNFYNAIGATSGDLIFLADQDDIWEAEKIEKTVEQMHQLNAAVVCTNSRLIDENDQVIIGETRHVSSFLTVHHNEIEEITFQRLLKGNVVQGCTYCFTKEVKTVFLQVQSVVLPHDYQIMLIGAVIGKVYFYNHVLLNYRIHSQNAIGLGQKSEKRKILKITPTMVSFFLELNRIIPVPHMLNLMVFYYYRSIIRLALRR